MEHGTDDYAQARRDVRADRWGLTKPKLYESELMQFIKVANRAVGAWSLVKVQTVPVQCGL